MLSNVIVASYNLAVIWLMQLDVFYTWRYIPTHLFGKAQGEHFWNLFITVFPQAIAALVIAVWLLKARPESMSANLLRFGAGIQVLIWLLTALLWGRWQGQIAIPTSTSSAQALGPANWQLYQTLLHTHWIRVSLITAYWMLAVWLAWRTIKGLSHVTFTGGKHFLDEV
ncbi:hypothetical protein [Rubrobacter xylanophilus]|uniref:hypothetical protein n=1 Tax=Rubrobacter xylanophilus TaxID=49319 RepID=UPI001C640629|nr:hypothetical protein [Rubrobacter xylanophilus]